MGKCRLCVLQYLSYSTFSERVLSTSTIEFGTEFE